MTPAEIQQLQPGDRILVQRPGHSGKVEVWLDSIDPATNRFSGTTASDRRINGNLRNATFVPRRAAA